MPVDATATSSSIVVAFPNFHQELPSTACLWLPALKLRLMAPLVCVRLTSLARANQYGVSCKRIEEKVEVFITRERLDVSNPSGSSYR